VSLPIDQQREDSVATQAGRIFGVVPVGKEFSRCTIQAIQTSAVSAKPDRALPVFAELRRGRPRHPLLLVVGGVALAVIVALAYGLVNRSTRPTEPLKAVRFAVLPPTGFARR